jgi:uncharacterized repeat protein (TIGR03803 family)
MLSTRSHTAFGKILFVLAINLAFSNLAGAGTKEKVLHRFDYKHGAFPAADLIEDEQGNLYGVTSGGDINGYKCGVYDCGVVFELSRSAGGGWTYSVLYAFKGGADAGNPDGRLIFDKQGNLYGAAASDGPNGGGAIFKLTPGSGGSWTESFAHSFPSNGNDGYFPAGDLVSDAKGNLYGSTLSGLGGVVYELSPQPDGSWSETVLCHFDNESYGEEDFSGVVVDEQGNVYGSTFLGNDQLHSKGTVFELSPNSHGGWNEKIIHNFLGTFDGSSPRSPLTLDSAGNLYGSTTAGGANGLGTIFKLSLGSRGKWQEKVIYNFNYDNGLASPERVVFDSQGDILGTSFGGGSTGSGMVWELSPHTGGGWKAKVLYNFQNGSDGSRPLGLLIGNDGSLCGPTESGGGRYGYGTVFEVVP